MMHNLFFVRSFVAILVCEQDILQTNEPILLQISTIRGARA